MNDIVEINIENPIDFASINRFREDLLNVKKGTFLIIDTRNHDFVSVEAVKYFRDQFDELEMYLNGFRKIALIRPAQYLNESSNPEVYNYFDNKTAAKKWFLNG